MCSTCFGHEYIHHQELATMLLNYHIGPIVLASMCVGVSLCLGWNGIRVTHSTRGVALFSHASFLLLLLILLLLPLAPKPNLGFGLSNSVLPFFPICHQLSPSSHSQHLKIFSTSSFHLSLGLPLILVPSSS